MLIKNSLPFFAVLFLVACSTPIKKADWPADIPPYEFFVSYYQQDPVHMQVSSQQRYLKWIKNFYLGSIYYRKGWVDVTREVLATLPDEQDRKIATEKLYLVGKDSSAEWAKDRSHRLINLRHVVIWGNAINESLVRQNQIETLDKILEDIHGLLAKRIEESDINAERYFKQDNIESDEDLFTDAG